MTPPLETANTSAIRSASISPMVDLACPSASIPAAAAKREIALARRRRGCGGKSVSASAGTRKAERSEEHTSELQSRQYLVCRLLLEKKKKKKVRAKSR